jgi:ADP-heptose:LPS heptosyltransferase
LTNYIELMKMGLRDGLKFVILGLDTMLSGLACAHFAPDSVMDLCGRTSLGQMIASIRQCDIFLSADTGSSHVAQACRVPTVVLFGPSNEKEFSPADLTMHTLLLPPEQPSCRPCVLGPCVRSRSCIQSITAEQAYAAVKQKVDVYSRNKPVSKPQNRVQPQNILCKI